MTVINGQRLLSMAPIKNMAISKQREDGVSYGLSEAGYDIRIKQDVIFDCGHNSLGMFCSQVIVNNKANEGRFTIASAIEEFQMVYTSITRNKK